MQPQIIEKIRNLIALSNNNSNENESANAWAQAQKLLTKCNISLLEINNSDDTDEHATIVAYETGGRGVSWKNHLIRTLAEINSCYSFRLTTSQIKNGRRVTSKYKRMLAGEQSKIEIVNYFFKSICSQVDILTAQFLKENHSGRKGAKTVANSYRLGLVDRVLERLIEAQEDSIKEEDPGTAMVLVDEYDKAKDWATEKFDLVSVKTTKISYDPSILAQGVRDGDNINLAKGLEENNKSGGIIE